MKFSTYFGLSSLVSAATVYYAFWTRGQFYYTVVFLTTNRVTMLIMGNMALTLTLGAGLLAKRTFLGQLRDVEVELLYESSRFAIMETCLALTIFREELSARVVTLFTALLFFKAFHWLARARVEHIEQTDTQSLPAHVRLVGLLLVLLFCDISIVNACILVLAEHRPSVLILFAFEFAILGVAAGGTLARYILHLADMRVDGAWQGKHSCLFFLEFTTEVLRFFFYLVFFGIIFLYYGMPLHIVRDLWVSYSTLRRRLQTYTRYRQLTANMNERFPSATEAELDNCERTCIICRDGMEEGKKLPCGHIFHFQCLRMWLQQQQTCPTCRADIPARAPSPPPRPARQPEAAPVSNASPRPSEPVLILDPGSSPTTPLLSGHRTLGGRAGSGLLADIVAVKVKVPSAPILEIPGPVEMGREVRRVALGE
jgi:E3 ubiquitin-protein ligase synoviolin